MQNLTIQITEEELSGLLQAYQTLQAFLEKFTSPNELYRADFLNGLKEAQDDVKAGRLISSTNRPSERYLSEDGALGRK
jgi:hypothetical protein